MSFTKPAVKPFEEDDVALMDETASGCRLILWNDEVNTFDWVIKALVEICGHTDQQAEQCAMIIHFNGKYAVKQGDFETLRPMCEAMIDRSINATIEDES